MPETVTDTQSAAAAPPPSAAEAPVAPEPATEPISDVWSRPQRRYRLRAIVLLALNFILFCGLCVFTHWLHTAEPFNFALSSYVEPFRFWGSDTMNLIVFLREPISVVDRPVHGIVLGLLAASMVAVPIAVAILYRFRFSLPFALAVAVFAHLPWMAITLVGSCILAGVKPFRMKFRYGSALLALVPVVVYLILAGRGAPGQVEAFATPEQQFLLVAPWVVAIIAASLMLGVMLWIASIVRYRPGAVAPVLAAMLVPPAVLFHTQIGVDELSYRVLESEFGPRSPRFQPTTDVEERLQELVQQYVLPRDVIRQVWTGRDVEPLRRQATRGFLVDLLALRTEADAACQQFLTDHPTSRYLPNVLYIQARSLDTRLDEQALRQRLRRELYNDFPSAASFHPWSVLWKQYPDSPLAVAAAVRLAQLHLRRGEVPEALERLQLVVTADGLTPAAQATTQPTPGPGLTTHRSPEDSLRFEPLPFLIEAQRLAELITNNRDDPRYGNAPLQTLARLDPRRAGYGDQLLRAARQYPQSLLHDNLFVLWAEAGPTPADRMARLRWCIEKFPEGDALPEALFHLGDMLIQAPAEESAAARQRGVKLLRQLAADHPHTIWGRRAAQRLAMLEPATTVLPPAEPETE